MDKPDLIALAQRIATDAHLDPALVCAVVEQESDWDPWAVRYEPAYDRRYILPMHLRPTAEILRAMSWGLMQVMGESARGVGYEGPIPQLCDPWTGLTTGCVLLANDLRYAVQDVAAALLRWNGGGNPDYPAQVMARMKNYA